MKSLYRLLFLMLFWGNSLVALSQIVFDSNFAPRKVKTTSALMNLERYSPSSHRYVPSKKDISASNELILQRAGRESIRNKQGYPDYFYFYEIKIPGDSNIYRMSQAWINSATRFIGWAQAPQNPPIQKSFQQTKTPIPAAPSTPPKLKPFRPIIPETKSAEDDSEDQTSEMLKCLNAEPVKKNIEELYPKNQCDNEIPGTCAGYAAVNAIEAALYRYFKEELKTPLAKTYPILTEPLYQMAFASYAEQNPGEFASRFKINDGINYNLMYGVYAAPFIKNLIHVLKETHALHIENPKNLSQAKKVFNESNEDLKQAIKVAEKALPDEKDPLKLLTTKLPNIKDDRGNQFTLLEHIKSILDNNAKKLLDEEAEVGTRLGVPGEFFESLEHKTIFAFNQHNSENRACDLQKLKRTFLRYLCADIPITVSGAFPSVLKGAGHAMLVTGFKHKSGKNGRSKNSPDSDLVFLARNSHGSNEPIEIPFNELCHSSYADVIYAGSDGGNLPAVERYSVYDHEESPYAQEVPHTYKAVEEPKVEPKTQEKHWSFPWNHFNWGGY